MGNVVSKPRALGKAIFRYLLQTIPNALKLTGLRPRPPTPDHNQIPNDVHALPYAGTEALQCKEAGLPPRVGHEAMLPVGREREQDVVDDTVTLPRPCPRVSSFHASSQRPQNDDSPDSASSLRRQEALSPPAPGWTHRRRDDGLQRVRAPRTAWTARPRAATGAFRDRLRDAAADRPEDSDVPIPRLGSGEHGPRATPTPPRPAHVQAARGRVRDRAAGERARAATRALQLVLGAGPGSTGPSIPTAAAAPQQL